MQKFLRFGAMVIGRERAAEQKQLEQERRTKFGPMVLGDKVVEGTNTPAPDAKPVGAATLGVAKTMDLLKRQPTMTLIYLEAELRRKDGPRRQVLEGIRDGLEAGTLTIIDASTSPADVIDRIGAVLVGVAPANK